MQNAEYLNLLLTMGSASEVTEDMIKYQRAINEKRHPTKVSCKYCGIIQSINDGRCDACGAPLPMPNE